MKRNSYSKDEADKRVKTQFPIDQKRDMATYVIDNSKNLKHLQNECEKFVETIKEKYGK